MAKTTTFLWIRHKNGRVDRAHHLWIRGSNKAALPQHAHRLVARGLVVGRHLSILFRFVQRLLVVLLRRSSRRRRRRRLAVLLWTRRRGLWIIAVVVVGFSGSSGRHVVCPWVVVVGGSFCSFGVFCLFFFTGDIIM